MHIYIRILYYNNYLPYSYSEIVDLTVFEGRRKRCDVD